METYGNKFYPWRRSPPAPCDNLTDFLIFMFVRRQLRLAYNYIVFMCVYYALIDKIYINMYYLGILFTEE